MILSGLSVKTCFAVLDGEQDTAGLEIAATLHMVKKNCESCHLEERVKGLKGVITGAGVDMDKAMKQEEEAM